MKSTQPVFKSAKKAEPFGAHFASKLESANSKLVCALSAATTCTDDQRPPFDVPQEEQTGPR
jgi:hypothetical protein